MDNPLPAPPTIPTDGHDLWPALTQGFQLLAQALRYGTADWILHNLLYRNPFPAHFPGLQHRHGRPEWNFSGVLSMSKLFFTSNCLFARKTDHHWPLVIWISNSGIPPTNGGKSKLSEVSNNPQRQILSSYLNFFWRAILFYYLAWLLETINLDDHRKYFYYLMRTFHNVLGMLEIRAVCYA